MQKNPKKSIKTTIIANEFNKIVDYKMNAQNQLCFISDENQAGNETRN